MLGVCINVYRSIRDRLKAERGQRGTATVMERSRDANLIAFASFQLRDYRSAVTETGTETHRQTDRDNAKSE